MKESMYYMIVLLLSCLGSYYCNIDSSNDNDKITRSLRFQWAQDNLAEYNVKKPSTGFYANTNSKRGIVIEGITIYHLKSIIIIIII